MRARCTSILSAPREVASSFAFASSLALNTPLNTTQHGRPGARLRRVPLFCTARVVCASCLHLRGPPAPVPECRPLQPSTIGRRAATFAPTFAEKTPAVAADAAAEDDEIRATYLQHSQPLICVPLCPGAAASSRPASMLFVPFSTYVPTLTVAPASGVSSAATAAANSAPAVSVTPHLTSNSTAANTPNSLQISSKVNHHVFLFSLASFLSVLFPGLSALRLEAPALCCIVGGTVK